MAIRAGAYYLLWGRIAHIAEGRGSSSAVHIVALLLGVGTTFMYAMDWILPLWTGVNFSSMGILFTALSASIALPVLYLSKSRYSVARHDTTSGIAKSVFGLSLLLMYLVFTHILIIVYADVPSEVVIFSAWWGNGLLWYGAMLAFFAVPFGILISAARRLNSAMLRAACIALYLGAVCLLCGLHATSPVGAAPYVGSIALVSVLIYYRTNIYAVRNSIRRNTNTPTSPL